MTRSARPHSLAVLLAILSPGSWAGSVAAPAASPELGRCAAISPASERLACYDASGCGGITAADERLACYDALANRKSSAGQNPPVLAPQPETAVEDPASFGLIKPQVAPQGPQKIDARVVSVTADRQGHVTLTLDNGQTWAVNEPDARLQSGDTVTIRHAALGSYLLTTPARHSFRVQRLK